jgi:hypothetical protein
MRVPKDALFNMLNLQTISTDGTVVGMFNPKGDGTYVIEVVGTPLYCLTKAAGLATKMPLTITGNPVAC